jgi:hypothetical protein
MRVHLAASILVFATTSPARAWQGCEGCTPLSDLGTGLYLGAYEGGLYSAGLNVPPPAQRSAALAAAGTIVARDAAGEPDVNGRIGFVSISMSNCNQEFSAFERRADLDDHRNAHLFVVNGAQGGQALDVISNPAASYWNSLALRIEAAGLSPAQVQAVWIKMADAAVPTTDFPAHALTELGHAKAVLQILKSTYPHLALAFFSSRTYGGNTTNPGRGEPLSYETGFAVKWLIEAQIAGDPALNHDPLAGPVVAPVLLWGPYLWANGEIPRSDGLVWLPEDFEGDGVHPSPDGEQKVAGLLEDFFQFDRFAAPWYGEPTEARVLTLEALADAAVDGGQPTTNFGADPTLVLGTTARRAYLKFDLAGLAGTVLEAKLSLISPPDFTSSGGAQLWGVGDTTWEEATITFATAPPLDGALHGQLPAISRGTAVSFDVSAAVQASSGGPVAFALASAPGLENPKEFLSREGGEAPRLVITLRPSCDEPGVPYCRSLPNSAGPGALIGSSGSSSVAQNDLVLTATGLPPNVPGLFYYGLSSAQAPFGEGLRCVAGPIARLAPPQFSGPTGALTRVLDFGAFPLGAGPLSVSPGDAVHFQCWYRDPSAGPAGFNLSDARQVSLCP